MRARERRVSCNCRRRRLRIVNGHRCETVDSRLGTAADESLPRHDGVRSNGSTCYSLGNTRGDDLFPGRESATKTLRERAPFSEAARVKMYIMKPLRSASRIRSPGTGSVDS